MYDQISQDSLKELYKIWKVKNTDDLETKSSNVFIVSFKFYTLSKEAKNIVLYVLKNESKELNSIDIAYSLKYTQKQIPAFFNYIDEIKKSGLLYLKIKRRRLNSHDDTLYFLPNVKPIIESIILKESIKITNYIDCTYTANIYKKYLQKIINIYENGNIIDYNKSKMNDDELFALCKANIVSVYFFGDDLKTYIGINNNNVLSNLEKSLKDNIDSSIFIYNHFNILNDIDTFIYECDVQKLCIDDININFLTNNIEPAVIINICSKLDLIKLDNKGFISLEYDNIKNYLSNSIDDRKELILKTIYKNYHDYYKKILDILEEGSISKSTLYVKLKEHNISLSMEMYNNIIYSMFVLGITEVSFYENAILAIRKPVIDDNNKKCFINGNFELTLINHYLFSNNFIYMCNLYFELDKQETVYTYTMTEESVLKGKTIISDEVLEYSFDKFLAVLKNILIDSNVEMPKHVETSIKRWYDRGIISYVYDNVTLVIIKDANKLEEIIHEAKRKGIIIKKISDEYAIVKSSSTTKKNLTKFLRQRKIIVTF